MVYYSPDGESYDPAASDTVDPYADYEAPEEPDSGPDVEVVGCSISPTHPKNSDTEGFILTVNVTLRNNTQTPLYAKWEVTTSGIPHTYRTEWVPVDGLSTYLTTPMDSGEESNLYEPGGQVTIGARVTETSLYEL